jgi:hypothetical protein
MLGLHKQGVRCEDAAQKAKLNGGRAAGTRESMDLVALTARCSPARAVTSARLSSGNLRLTLLYVGEEDLGHAGLSVRTQPVRELPHPVRVPREQKDLDTVGIRVRVGERSYNVAKVMANVSDLALVALGLDQRQRGGSVS